MSQLLKLRDSKKKPRSGWWLVDAGVRFESEDINTVVEKVKSYRKEYHRPEGDPFQEILRRLSETDPWMVEPDWGNKPPPSEAQPSDVILWLKEIYLKPGVFNSDSLAVKSNRETCTACKFNNVEYEYNESHKKLRFVMTGGKISEDLGVCDCHKWDNNMATLLESPNKTVDSPENCWVK